MNRHAINIKLVSAPNFHPELVRGIKAIAPRIHSTSFVWLHQPDGQIVEIDEEMPEKELEVTFSGASDMIGHFTQIRGTAMFRGKLRDVLIYRGLGMNTLNIWI